MLDGGAEGHIINTASMAGLVSSPYMAVYEATKHAVVAMTETLKMELDLTGGKLSASVLCPGFVATKISDSERNRPGDASGKSPTPGQMASQETIREMARQQVAAGIKPAEVAEMVLEAVRDDRFYILTHPRYKKLIRVRMENILEGRTPRFEPP
jgi:short-subunit dehydrogenase